MSTDGNSTVQPTTECYNVFNEKIYAAVAAVAATSGGISLIASLFIIFIIILFRKWKFYSQRLVFYLAGSAAALSLAFVLQRVDYQNQTSPPYTNFCIFGGFLGQVSSWMLLNAIICIMLALTIGTLSRWSPEKLEGFFIFFIFVFPFTFNWIPFIKSAYGRAGAWCWILSEDRDTCERFTYGRVLQQVLWYVPLYTIMGVLIILYVLVVIKICLLRRKWTGTYDPMAEKEKKMKDKMSKETLTLIAYPIVFFSMNIPPFINRLQILFDPGNPALGLWFLSAAILPLQGAAIATLFILDAETRRNLKPANFRAAFSEFCSKRRVEEYPMEENIESSMEETGKISESEYHQWSQGEPLVTE